MVYQITGMPAFRLGIGASGIDRVGGHNNKSLGVQVECEPKCIHITGVEWKADNLWVKHEYRDFNIHAHCAIAVQTTNFFEENAFVCVQSLKMLRIFLKF